MSKKIIHLSPRAQRKAEEEMDAFLRRINGASSTDILAELKQLS